MSSIEKIIKQELETSVFQSLGISGGGCISQGTAFKTDSGNIFVKYNNKSEALRMFEGEFESLSALKSAGVVRVPKPIKVICNPKGGAVLVMEYLDIGHLSKSSKDLGMQMARLHLHNSELNKKAEKKSQSVHKGNYSYHSSQFGFPVTTCCGYLPQDNEWRESWPEFFAKKIHQHVQWAQENYNDRKVGSVWSTLMPNLYKLFKDIKIEPALLHGDLWGGNAGEADGAPVIFDPASFYGHAEYDLAISKMFGGFGRDYFNSYHNVLPKQQGFDDRQDIYMMFHYFNHWNHFGGGYRGSTMQLMEKLAKKYSC